VKAAGEAAVEDGIDVGLENNFGRLAGSMPELLYAAAHLGEKERGLCSSDTVDGVDDDEDDDNDDDDDDDDDDDEDDDDVDDDVRDEGTDEVDVCFGLADDRLKYPASDDWARAPCLGAFPSAGW
jgi:hypothetical protein